MARVRRVFDPGGRARRVSVRALIAAVALVFAPLAIAADLEPAASPRSEPCLSFRSLAARPILVGAAPRFLDRVWAPPSAPDRLSFDWKRFLREMDQQVSAARNADRAPRSGITLDSGTRVGCRIGDVVPYARLDVRTFDPRDGAIGENPAASAGPFRALGVRFDLDTRTVLQFEASLGEPDMGSVGPRYVSDDRSLGLAIRLAWTF
jgi:hypothetical protein